MSDSKNKDKNTEFTLSDTDFFSANIERARGIMEFFPAPGRRLDRDYVIPNTQSNLDRIISVPAAVVTGTTFGAFVLVVGTASNILSLHPIAAIDTLVVGTGLIVNGIASPIVDPIIAVRDKMSGIPFRAMRLGDESKILGFPVAKHLKKQTTPSKVPTTDQEIEPVVADPTSKLEDGNAVLPEGSIATSNESNKPSTHPKTTEETASTSRIKGLDQDNQI